MKTKFQPLTAHGIAALALALLLTASVWWAQRTLGNGVLPHGYCLTWIPGLLWLHVVSDSLIALAYLSIPVTLLYFVRQRSDIPFGWMMLLFGAFIVACGATHAFDVWTLWNPDYWLSGGVKALTAGISVMTAFALVGVIPKALAMPSLEALQSAKRSLEQEIERRLAVEAQLRAAKDELERRVVERTAQLTKAHALLDAVIDAAPVGIAVLDAEYRYVRVNSSMARINGIAVEAHGGRRLHDVVPGVAPAVVEHLEETRRTGAPLIGMEVTGQTAGSGENATFRVSYFGVRATADEPVLTCAICEDISERRASEAERARLLQQAEAANRLKDEFMARVSHELRTPLQALMSWTTLLRQGNLEPERGRHAIDRIDHNVRLQARMISDLLDISRILSGTLDLQWSRICYFWPNMLGFVGHYLPQTGALGLSIMGGIGMFSSSMFQPIIGGWIQSNKTAAEARGLAGDAADLAAGQATLTNMMIFPGILIVAFAILYFVTKKKQVAAA